MVQAIFWLPKHLKETQEKEEREKAEEEREKRAEEKKLLEEKITEGSLSEKEDHGDGEIVEEGPSKDNEKKDQ